MTPPGENPQPPGAAGAFVRAVINPARRDDALRVLMRLGITAVNLHNAVGADRGAGGEICYSEWSVLEFRAPEEMKDEVLLALKSAVRSSRRNNDGKIFVLEAGDLPGEGRHNADE